MKLKKSELDSNYGTTAKALDCAKIEKTTKFTDFGPSWPEAAGESTRGRGPKPPSAKVKSNSKFRQEHAATKPSDKLRLKDEKLSDKDNPGTSGQLRAVDKWH